MIKTNKDVIFWIICLLWPCSNMILWWLLDLSYVSFSNLFYVIVMIILIYLKNTNSKFNNWLEKRIWLKR